MQHGAWCLPNMYRCLRCLPPPPPNETGIVALRRSLGWVRTAGGVWLPKDGAAQPTGGVSGAKPAGAEDGTLSAAAQPSGGHGSTKTLLAVLTSPIGGQLEDGERRRRSMRRRREQCQEANADGR